MKQKFDLHMHTTYCDGKNSAEEMILAAVSMGLETVGLSGHSYTWFDESYCMSEAGTEEYIAEVTALKEKYRGRIRVLLGTEVDFWAGIDPRPYDYLIGSSHYILKDGDYIDTDYSPEILRAGIDKHFGGDPVAAAAAYYEQAGAIVKRCGCDIVGHFDLITKFNESDHIVDTTDPRYIAAWRSAVDRIFADTAELRQSGRMNKLEEYGLIRAGDKPVFEINTGAIAKGYRTSPYPAVDQIEYIKSRGGILILSSDSHSTDKLCWEFDKYSYLI